MNPGTNSERATTLSPKDIILSNTAQYRLFRDIKILWHLGYYDGIISGIALNLKDNKQYYFDQIGSFDYLGCSFEDEGAYEVEAVRIYAIYELTAEQLDHLNYWHNEFSTLVGNHINYNDRGVRTLGTHPGWMESGFYERHKEAVYPKQDKKWAIGWFVW